MATLVNLYKAASNLEMTLMEDVAMQESTSHARYKSATSGSSAVDPPLGEH